MTPKRKRNKSQEAPPGGSLRERRAWSPEAWEQFAARRGQPLTILAKEVNGTQLVELPLEDMLELKIDTSYQRAEVRSEVNALVNVLMNGGVIPEPILVSERPDGARYIVDGQQRWLAHFDAQKPIRAIIIKVPNVAVEAKLFQVTNDTTRLAAALIVRSWPGASARILARLNEHGPLAGQISYSPSMSKVTFPCTAVIRGLIALSTSSTRGGKFQEMLQLLDRAYERNKEWVVKAADGYAEVIARTFHGNLSNRCRPLPAIAVGAVCRTHWENRRGGGDSRWPMPDEKQYKRLAKIQWETLAETWAERYLPNLKAAVFSIWPPEKK